MDSRTIVLVAGTKKDWKGYMNALNNFKDSVSWIIDQDDNVSSYCVKGKSVHRVGIVTFRTIENLNEFNNLLQEK